MRRDHHVILSLTVAELARSVDYNEQSLGLELLDRRGSEVSLGVGERELLVLIEEPGAGASHGYTGLYHFALLVPERADLARWLAPAARARIALVGLSDHFVSQAIYLTDPDTGSRSTGTGRARSGKDRSARA
jgi:catechol 2,3-dioxygenase